MLTRQFLQTLIRTPKKHGRFSGERVMWVSGPSNQQSEGGRCELEVASRKSLALDQFHYQTPLADSSDQRCSGRISSRSAVINTPVSCVIVWA